jgi:DNA repair exonuclease SbcCD ATPase subunit
MAKPNSDFRNLLNLLVEMEGQINPGDPVPPPTDAPVQGAEVQQQQGAGQPKDTNSAVWVIMEKIAEGIRTRLAEFDRKYKKLNQLMLERMKQYTGAAAGTAASLESVSKELEGIKTNLDMSRGMVARLTQRIQELEQTFTQTRQQLERQVQQLQELLDAYMAQHGDDQAALAAKDRDHAAALAGKDRELAAKDVTIAGKDEEIRKKMQIIQGHLQELGELEAQLEEAGGNAGEIQEQLEAAIQEAAELSRELEETKDREAVNMEEMMKMVEELNGYAEDVKLSYDDAVDKFGKLEQEYETLQTKMRKEKVEGGKGGGIQRGRGKGLGGDTAAAPAAEHKKHFGVDLREHLARARKADEKRYGKRNDKY